jgi:hypothetical protein
MASGHVMAVRAAQRGARCAWSFLQDSPGKQWLFPVKLSGNTAVISKRTRTTEKVPLVAAAVE